MTRVGFGVAAFVLTATCPAAANPSAQEISLRTILQSDLAKIRIFDRSDLRYSSSFVDLNGDGVDEAVIWMQGRDVCGSGGCNLYIYKRSGANWRKITGITITWPPIKVLEQRHNGWKDLSVFVAGGGILPGYEARLSYDGRTYPSNPTNPSARNISGATGGRVLIGPTEQGKPLF